MLILEDVAQLLLLVLWLLDHFGLVHLGLWFSPSCFGSLCEHIIMFVGHINSRILGDQSLTAGWVLIQRLLLSFVDLRLCGAINLLRLSEHVHKRSLVLRFIL